jgi:hypothetical protein
MIAYEGKALPRTHPNERSAYALHLTAPAVTLAASGHRLAATVQPARQPPQSLSFGSLPLDATALMPSKANTFPEIRVIMISFDLMPRHDAGVMQMARGDVARMKKVTKANNALSRCNAYRVSRSNAQVRIEFLDMNQPEESRVRLRMIYELAPPFA